MCSSLQVHTCTHTHTHTQVQENLCVCMCVCVCVCMCLYSLLLGNLSFSDTYTVSLSTSCLGDCKVARVCWPSTDFKLVFRPWESGSHTTFTRSDKYYVYMSVFVYRYTHSNTCTCTHKHKIIVGCYLETTLCVCVCVRVCVWYVIMVCNQCQNDACNTCVCVFVYVCVYGM